MSLKRERMLRSWFCSTLEPYQRTSTRVIRETRSNFLKNSEPPLPLRQVFEQCLIEADAGMHRDAVDIRLGAYSLLACSWRDAELTTATDPAG
jgi:hypothetical protein